MTDSPSNPQSTKVCPSCEGQGQIADYVGLEMHCVGVDCDRCKGTGRIAVQPALTEEEDHGDQMWRI